MKEKKFIINWKDKGCINERAIYATNKEEAMQKAKEFGWTKPKWWQWWRWQDFIFTLDK